MLLHRLVSEHLDTFLATFREAHDKPLPRYVDQELRAFLDCGDLRCGFALAKCRNCGRRIAVGLSCKRRGVCGSCIARRMADAAAHMVDHVFPVVPVRQWVLSTPFEIRLLLARDAAHVVSKTLAFAGGNGGAMIRWDGVSWQPFQSGFTGFLRNLWAFSSNDVWASAPRTRHWNGSAWSDTPYTCNAIWAADAQNLFCATLLSGPSDGIVR